MRETTRLIATGIIWVAFVLIMAIIAAALVITDASLDLTGPGILFGIIVTLIIGVANSTEAIWNSPIRTTDSTTDNTAAIQTSKSKRTQTARVGRLIDGLDDDEIYELESLLLAREQQTERQQRGH